jgi:hypothetical protein
VTEFLGDLGVLSFVNLVVNLILSSANPYQSFSTFFAWTLLGPNAIGKIAIKGLIGLDEGS